MMRKRRITASPVSTAFLSSGTGGSRWIVSCLSGAEGSLPSSSTTDASGCLPLRVMVHSFGGLLQAEARLDRQRSPVAGALLAVSEDAVLACRCRPPTAATDEETMAFFAGRQRLAAVTLSDAAVAAGPLPAGVGYDGRYPMQCISAAELRAPVAVFVAGPDTLCACAPQPCKEQRMQFHGCSIACVGAGREGEATMTILFDNHTIALVGVRPWLSTETEPAMRGLNDKPPAQFAILKTGALPGVASSVPIRVLWSGWRYMWVVYEDSSLCAFECCDPELEGGALWSGEGGGEDGGPRDIEFTLLYAGRLPWMEEEEVLGFPEGLWLFAESRVPSLHYCYAQQDKSVMYYGTIQLHSHKSGAEAEPTRTIKKSYTISFGEVVYGLHVEGGRYHVLTQSRRGDSPLYLTTLPLSIVACGPAEAAPLYQQITHALEDDLGEHCRTCEARIAAICKADPNTLRDRKTLASMLTELTELQHSVYALLSREQSSTNQKLSPSQSYPQRILLQLSRAFMQTSVYLFLSRLNVLHSIVQPLRESLDLNTARTAAVDAQEALIKMINTVFPSLSTSEPNRVELCPPRESLCVDVILEHLGYSSETSLKTILCEATEMSPTLALLVLYYSYQDSFFDEDCGSCDITPAVQEHQRQENALREEFLTSRCRLPVSLNTWAFACCAVDHGINPLAKSPAGSPFYRLGAQVCHLSSPPVLALHPALVSGLLSVAAVGAAYQQTAAVLGGRGWGPSPSRGCLPLPLALRLSFVALSTHADGVVAALYRAARGTESEGVSLQALALAALQRGEVGPLRGLICVGSAQERVVERVLGLCREEPRRGWVRLQFYALMRRYADALEVCRGLPSPDLAAGQLTQMIASSLRSLMPVGNERYLSQYLQHSGPATSLHLQLNEEENEQKLRWVNGGVAGKGGNLLACMSMVPTSLENRQDELDEQVRCAMARCASQSSRRAPRILGLPISSRPKAAAKVDLQPSTILSSLDQNGHGLSTVPGKHNQLEIEKEDEEEISPENDKSAAFCSTRELQHSRDWSENREHNKEQQKQNKHNNGRGSTMFNTNVGNFSDVVLCEARLQRSGKLCNRARPCPYHDRKG